MLGLYWKEEAEERTAEGFLVAKPWQKDWIVKRGREGGS